MIFDGNLFIKQDGSGVLTADRELRVLNGLEAWGKTVYGNDPQKNYFSVVLENSAYADSSKYAQTISNLYPYVDIPNSESGIGMNVYNDGSACTLCVRPVDPTITLNDFVDDLGTNNLKVLFYLASPVSYEFTAEQIASLKTMTVWANTGDVLEFDYPMDTKTYIDNLFATIVPAEGVSF